MERSVFEKLARANEIRNTTTSKVKDLEVNTQYIIRGAKRVRCTNGLAILLSLLHPTTKRAYAVYIGEEYLDVFDLEVVEDFARGLLRGSFVYVGAAGLKQLYTIHLEETNATSPKRQRQLTYEEPAEEVFPYPTL